MAMGMRKFADWLGLVEGERYDQEEQSEEMSVDVYEDEPSEEMSQVSRLPERTDRVERERVERVERSGSSEQRRRPVAAVPTPQPELADISRIVSVRPRSYNEARAIGENFRDGIPVIMNLSDMEAGEDKRLVDFAAGLIFGLRGNIERVSSQVFLLCPANLVVGPEDKERLASGGFFNQS